MSLPARDHRGPLLWSTLVADCLWIAGLARVVAELGHWALSGSGQSAAATAGLVLSALIVAGIEVIVVWRWSWVRGLMRQAYQDGRGFWGLPPGPIAKPVPALYPAPYVAILFGGALVLAAVLPGPVAAAAALVVGAIGRTAAAVWVHVTLPVADEGQERR
jgi:hypothetical protein